LYHALASGPLAAPPGAGTLARTFDLLSAADMSSTTCKTMFFDGGCVPWEVNYGTAVLGIVDSDHATLPVRLAVDGAIEPDVAAGQPPNTVHITVTVEDLQSGKNYVLLRYSDPTSVP
jgi:hypothetical protein